MFNIRIGRIAVLAAACAAFAVPASASALTVPGVGEVPLPPEVEEVTGPLVADALTQVIGLDMPYVAQAESAPGKSSASAIDVPGVLTVGKAESDKTGSKVTTLSVGGTDLLVKEGDANGGTNTGELAAVGDEIDKANAANCRTATNPNCVTVLQSSATESGTASNRTNSAGFNLATADFPGENVGLTVLPVSALTNLRSGAFCTDVSTAFVATGRGALALLAIVGPKIKIGGFFAAC